MDKDFPNSDMPIYDQTWYNFNSEALPSEQSGVNFDPTMVDKSHPDPLDSLLDDSSGGFGPMIHNHDTSDNILDWVNLPDYEFNTCMDQAELWTTRAMMVYKETESAFEASILNQDILQEELKQRDEVIHGLQKDIEQEKVRRSQQVQGLQRELQIMGKLVKDYREQLKDVNSKFEEYRARVLHNLTHSDNAVRSGCPILSTKGHEKPWFAPIEQIVREFEAGWSGRFEEHINNFHFLSNRLFNVEKEVVLLWEVFAKIKSLKGQNVLE